MKSEDVSSDNWTEFIKCKRHSVGNLEEKINVCIVKCVQRSLRKLLRDFLRNFQRNSLKIFLNKFLNNIVEKLLELSSYDMIYIINDRYISGVIKGGLSGGNPEENLEGVCGLLEEFLSE